MRFIKTAKNGTTYVALKSPENTYHWVMYHKAMELIKMGYSPARDREINEVIKLHKP